MPSADKVQKIQYHIARTKKELEEAFALVYKEYAQRGYIPKHYKSKLRLSLFNALPTTTTFVAKQGRRVVATVTLIPDSPLGIPMDKIYKREVDRLRRKGRNIAEVSQLSIDSKLFPPGWFSMFNFAKLIFVFKLFKLVLDYALYVNKVSDFCIVINPQHQYLYKFLGFEVLGGFRYYGSVNRAPAIAKRLNLEVCEKIARNRKGLYKIFFGYKIDPDALSNKYQLSLSDLEYFFVKKSDIFKKTTNKQFAYLESCYPVKGFNKIRKNR
jgi:hypothetical protein